MATYIKKAIKSIFIIYLFSAIGAITGYLVRILFAHELSVAEYGLFYAVYGLVALIFSFKDVGYGMALVRYIPVFKIKKRFDDIKSSIIFVLLVQVIYSFISLIILFLLADYLSLHYFYDNTAVILIKIVAVSFFLLSFVETLYYSFRGFQRFFLFSAMSQLSMLCVLILSFVLFKVGFAYLTPALAYLFSEIIFIVIFSIIFIKKTFPDFFKQKLAFKKSLIMKLTKFSIPQLFTNSITTTMGSVDTIMLTMMVGVVGVGFYNVAMPTAKLASMIGVGLCIFLVPFVAELWAKNHKQHLSQGIELIYKYLFIVAMPFVVVMFAFSGLIISFFFGGEYALAEMPMKVLVLGMLCFTLFGVNSSVLTGINKPKINAKILSIAILFNIIGNFVLIKLFDVTGAAIATALTYLLLLGMSLYYVKKFTGVKLPIKEWIKTLAISLFIVLVIYILGWALNTTPYVEVTVILLIVSILYCSMLHLFNLFSLTELKRIVSQIRAKEQPIKTNP